MGNKFIQHIIKDWKTKASNVLLVENSDGFLQREDVIDAMSKNDIEIVHGSGISQRINYELRDKTKILAIVSHDNSNYLEDIKQNSVPIDFFLEAYIRGYHISSIVDQDISILEILHATNQVHNLSSKDTLIELQKIQSLAGKNDSRQFNFRNFVQELDEYLRPEQVDWKLIIQLISAAIAETIGTDQFIEVMVKVNDVNKLFQEKLEADFHASKSSSAVKRPKIVSRILEYIDFNFKNEKVALIVVDGLAYWQYQLLRNKLPGAIDEEVIYSWIPSITQLSRQAIFRGDTPKTDYRQGPINEGKLWKKYWSKKGLNDYKVRYNHENIDLDNLTLVQRFAIVYKDLDEKMHSSTDYNDLLKLTENWIDRSEIVPVIDTLLESGFHIILTTDHGNIQAKGWRGLLSNEKLGTNKSGSRSERHLEYSDKWLSDDFIENNPELKNSIVMEEQTIYFKDDLSFSKKETLVTHGGAHLLEVLIPFIEISNE